MKFYADLHIHSKYSRACSKRLTIPNIYKWAQIKGINLIATSDFTHPLWIEDIKKYLSEEGNGLLHLKSNYRKQVDREIPTSCKNELKFILSSEISLIYKKNEKVRKVHIVTLAPDIKTVDKIRNKLSSIGNIKSDGRPILGYDSQYLLKLILDINDKCLVIPAHIWTPWFSMFGDKSGFESIEECFEDQSKYIYAIETGLSSDPPMNWMVKGIDGLSILSNSDAHSPENIAREANIFDCKLYYESIAKSIKTNNKNLLGTIEFYPQEGMYHYDGHRKCDISWHPRKTNKHDAICPKCGKRLTVGVLNRVYKLADRKIGQHPVGAKPFFYVIPLRDILSHTLDKGKNTKTLEEEYFRIINKFGSELNIALDTKIDDLKGYSLLLAEAISRIRSNKVDITPGYDGVYGKVNIFEREEIEKMKRESQMSLV